MHYKVQLVDALIESETQSHNNKRNAAFQV